MNYHEYAGGSPLRFIDPLGLAWYEGWGLTLQIFFQVESDDPAVGAAQDEVAQGVNERTDNRQNYLSALSEVPVAGKLADVTSAALDASQGDLGGVVTNLLSLLPGGDSAKGGKKALGLLDDVADTTLHCGDKVAEGTAKLGDKLGDLTNKLDDVPAPGANSLPNPPAATAGKEYGSYTNYHESGNRYHGQGNRTRSQASGREKAAEYNDPHTATDWTPASNRREAMKDEARRIRDDGGIENPENYNRINSPGRRYLGEDGN